MNGHEVSDTAGNGPAGGQSGAPDGILSGKLAGKIKRKPGRPKGSKTKKEPSRESVSGMPDAYSPKSEETDCAFFVETVVSLVQAGDEFLANLMLDRFRRYVPDTAKVDEFSKRLLSAATLGPREEEILRTQLVALALKYNVLRKIGPEFCLAVWIGQYGLRWHRVYRFVESCRPTAVQPKPEAGKN